MSNVVEIVLAVAVGTEPAAGSWPAADTVPGFAVVDNWAVAVDTELAGVEIDLAAGEKVAANDLILYLEHIDA